MRKLNAIPNQDPAVSQNLRPGDVVAFRFPVLNGNSEGPPQVRPCLVLAVDTMATTPFVTIAYGIKDNGNRCHDAFDLLVVKPEEISKAGLNGPTRFISRYAVSVSIKNDGFDRDVYGSPVIGAVTGPALSRLRQIRTRIRAEAVAAAAYRDHRRRKSVLKSESKKPAPCQDCNDHVPCHRRHRARAQI